MAVSRQKESLAEVLARLAYSYWSTLSASRLADAPENHTLFSFALAPADGGTLLTLTLSDFAEPAIRPHADLYWGRPCRS
ncbi:hypothetical protein [Mesorhizobium sp. NZP2077]|uniref:hypothetical protein n=1 Tax=Mesorhizobium sp. NZP2077 TaxID=2483404 RepID=UPI001FEFB449|nr:hypothetical protein [Mesorhizobium sp. NZP2077]